MKNGTLLPSHVSSMSNKKVWWKCDKGHEWQAVIANRSGKNKTGCPYCGGSKATETNNFAALFPHLVPQWNFQRNTKVRPEEVLPYSHLKVWWKCEKGHEWETGIAYRTKQGSGCPYCSGRLAGSDTSLGALHPLLTKEWHPTKNKELFPNHVRPGSDKKVWWICEGGHEWQAAISSRTHSTKATGCPYCSGRIATRENNVAVVCPELVGEWNVEKNGLLKPEMFKPGSNKKVWWKCIKGHEWRASPNKRTGTDKTGCPFCNPQTSRLEIRLLCELRHLFRDVRWREKIGGIEADIYVPEYGFAVEVDGYRWHIGKAVKDRVKSEQFNKMGVKLLRIRDKTLGRLSDSDVECNDNEEDIVIIHRLLESIVKHICLKKPHLESIEIYLLGNSLQNPAEYERILSYLPAPPPENSLAGRYKDLSKEWHYEKNTPLTPENFTPGARANVWWKCPTGHEYRSFIYNRIKGVGCPYCAGKRVSSDNNLAVKEPRLVGEWSLSRNELVPESIYFRSTRKVWWICKKGHEWLASPQKRVLGRGCPCCARKR
jgi:DNA-directed RNA polymerase subunit RPC12/RpoP